MKKHIIFILLFTCSASLKAQGLAEFFRQAAEQKKSLLQQIAALQVYIGYAHKGYCIAQKGLNTIGEIKDGEFNLHTGYFNSLKAVSPVIRNYGKVAETIALQMAILKVCKAVSRQYRSSKDFTGGEIKYLDGVYGRVMDDCGEIIDELTAVTTAGKLEMKDDERIQRIDKLYNAMQDSYTFTRSFSNGITILAHNRSQAQRDIQTSRELNGIKK